MLNPKTLLDALRYQLITHKEENEMDDDLKERHFKQGYNEALNDVYEEIGLIIDRGEISIDLELWETKNE